MTNKAQKDDDALKRLRKLHALLGSENAGERDNARRLIVEWLAKYRHTWNDLPELLQADASPSFDNPNEPPADAGTAFGTIPALDLVHDQLQRYLDMKPHEYVAVALWILHAHLYDKFTHTPRLVFVSPLENVGKSTALNIIEALLARVTMAASITPAALYHIIDTNRRPILLDEADNAQLVVDAKMRRVLNAGWSENGGTVTLMQGGAPRDFNLFAPIAMGSIGGLPRPLMSRSVIIRMERSARDDLLRFDKNNLGNLEIVYSEIFHWKHHVQLDTDPKMPPELRNRARDNWRPLIAIADTFGETWGQLARDAAIALSQDDHYENPMVLLLQDIRRVFDNRGEAKIASEALVAELVAIEDGGTWGEWRGLNDNHPPRKLTPAALARLLKEFGIRPQKRRQGQGFFRGYFRSQFEKAWTQNCPDTATPPQDNKIIRLEPKKAATKTATNDNGLWPGAEEFG